MRVGSLNQFNVAMSKTSLFWFFLKYLYPSKVSSAIVRLFRKIVFLKIIFPGSDVSDSHGSGDKKFPVLKTVYCSDFFRVHLSPLPSTPFQSDIGTRILFAFCTTTCDSEWRRAQTVRRLPVSGHNLCVFGVTVARNKRVPVRPIPRRQTVPETPNKRVVCLGFHAGRRRVPGSPCSCGIRGEGSGVPRNLRTERTSIWGKTFFFHFNVSVPTEFGLSNCPSFVFL